MSEHASLKLLKKSEKTDSILEDLKEGNEKKAKLEQKLDEAILVIKALTDESLTRDTRIDAKLEELLDLMIKRFKF